MDGEAACFGLGPCLSAHERECLAAKKRIGAIVILGADRRIVGILSERDIVRAPARMCSANL
jgi:CBS-domain-containing membrane protein